MFIYIIILLVTLIYFTITRKYGYWKSQNVKHVTPTFLVGNYGDVCFNKKNFSETIRDLCLQFENEKYIGAYYTTEPVLIPIDPEIIKLVMTKEFYYFSGREFSDCIHKEPLGRNLFATYGDTWKVLRQNMTPLFTSAKMKNMFHLIQKCSYEFENMIDQDVSISQDILTRDMVAKFTMECIVGCAFGIDANTMNENVKDNPFKKMTNLVDDVAKIAIYTKAFRTIWPSLYQLLGLSFFAKHISFFLNMIISVMEERDYKPSGRHDFVDLVATWKQENVIVGDSIKSLKGEPQKVSIEVDNNLLVAQCFVFFTAGFETSATTTSYTMYELAKHPEIQNRVLEEVDDYLARHGNKLEYECLREMPYLEACIDEALRLYPVLGMIPREATEDFVLPDGVKVKRGVRVHIPVHYLHHNPKYFKDPEEYIPERFLGEAKKNINPYTYMPFGEGPRMCIGMRFAKMQMLAGFITVLKKYRLELADGMPKTLQFKSLSLLTQPRDPIRLKFVERDGWQNRVLARQ